MARSLRRLILWLIAVPLVLVLLVAAALWWFVDPERLRLRLQAEATAMLGRQVVLEGPLRWNFAALLAIGTGPGSVGNAHGFGPEPLARWSDINLGLALRPLLKREVRIGRIAVDGLLLNLQQDAEGNGNWNFDLPESGGDANTLLRVGSLRLSDSEVRYHRADGAAWRLQQLALQLTLPEDLTAPDLQFGELQLQGVLSGGPLPASGVALRVGAPLMHVAMPRIGVQELTLQWGEARMRGSIQVVAAEALQASGRISVSTPSLRDSMATVGVQPPAMTDTSTLGNLRLDVVLDHRSGITELESLDLQLDDSRISGEATLASLSPLILRFDLAADRVALDRYMAPDEAPDEPLSQLLEQLRGLDVQGVLRIGEATLAGGEAKSVRIDVE